MEGKETGKQSMQTIIQPELNGENDTVTAEGLNRKLLKGLTLVIGCSLLRHFKTCEFPEQP